jgi:hypothetical protein
MLPSTPLLHRVRLRQRGVNHLERHDPGQLTDMTRREPARGDRDDAATERL